MTDRTNLRGLELLMAQGSARERKAATELYERACDVAESLRSKATENA